MTTVLLLIHLATFALGANVARWNRRMAESNLLLALGFFATPVFAFVVLVLLDTSNHAGNGTHGAWFLIFTVVTLGALPAVTLASSALSGLCLFRFLRWRQERKRHHKATLGQPTQRYGETA